MIKYLFIFLFFTFCLAEVLWAQVETEKFGNGENIRIPTQKRDSLPPRPDSLKTPPPKPKPEAIPTGASEIESGGFVLYKSLPLVSPDPLEKTVGTLQVVRVSEELQIDCVWVKAAEYYKIWDSKYINPYQKDAALFRDSVEIELYNIERGELWSAPLFATLQTSNFGYRWGRFHHGIDLNLNTGEPVLTAFDGIVRIAAFDRGYGNYVVVRHRNGLETLYAHLSARKVEVGQVLRSGQLVGLGGSTGWSTGPHLHFETRYEGNTFNPLLIYDFSREDQLLTERFTLIPKHFEHYGNKIRQTIIHKVNPGETLSIISAKYNVSVSDIAKLNRISENSILTAGQSLIIK
ncbi:MAG: peptidoglycan DD-metalloendopeptidase family protein [Microscillaceae bacterium]|nr:peptidoglycan DD-metalloendopeptidase family protein [Microscillaceae bacterium]